METDKEFLAIQRNTEKDAFIILKNLRLFTKRYKKEGTEYTRDKLHYWSKKADELIDGVPCGNEVQLHPFKSLMVQRAEGALSNKL